MIMVSTDIASPIIVGRRDRVRYLDVPEEFLYDGEPRQNGRTRTLTHDYFNCLGILILEELYINKEFYKLNETMKHFRTIVIWNKD